MNKVMTYISGTDCGYRYSLTRQNSRCFFAKPPRGSRVFGSSMLVSVLLAVFAMAPFAGRAQAQGSRKDDVVFNAQGRPMAGATVRVCTTTATGQPCSPLAPVYSDSALTQALANPLAADGLGNYNFYAA